jgi:hypothetical protein
VRCSYCGFGRGIERSCSECGTPFAPVALGVRGVGVSLDGWYGPREAERGRYDLTTLPPPVRERSRERAPKPKPQPKPRQRRCTDCDKPLAFSTGAYLCYECLEKRRQYRSTLIVYDHPPRPLPRGEELWRNFQAIGRGDGYDQQKSDPERVELFRREFAALCPDDQKALLEVFHRKSRSAPFDSS